MIKIFKLTLTTFILFILPSLSWAESIQCKSVEVLDGNTFNCLSYEDKIIKVKFYQIDAPDLNQPYGLEAQNMLKKLLSDQLNIPQIDLAHRLNYQSAQLKNNKFITVYIERKDGVYHYGEVEIFSYLSPCIHKAKIDMERFCFGKTTNVNKAMIQEGMAWSTASIFSRSRSLQKEASKAKRGLWAQPNPIPPWEWRKLQKGK